MNQKLQTLKRYFGYDSFREGQQPLIDVILSGRDCLGVMPTGAGKSICYQLPALMMDGITLVISPLISLMKDQVDALTQAGIRAAYINSSLTERQSRIALDNARLGHYKIIYVAPERLETDSFRLFAQNAGIAIVTVDEAHCISQWGQDFRPSYLGIRAFVDSLGRRPVFCAFTATATARVRDDIIGRLGLDNPYILVTGFDRENLFFEMQKPSDKNTALLRFLSDKAEQSGIVYCSTRDATEEVCDLLAAQGYPALRYHAGLADAVRKKHQDDFLHDRAKIIVATNAFGMGIDKSNVRYVVHYNMPKNIESYYQEAGRAERDGEAASCLLLYSGQDVRIAQYLIENSRDATYENAESERLIKELNRRRLKAMTFYCHTGGCLREYILRYFGENPQPFCGNCSNCLQNFETEDVTVTAQKILSCVKRMRERYGVKLAIDVLRGAKNEKIARLGLDKLSTYNICDESEKRLRDIVHHLVLGGYLRITDERYPLLTLGERAGQVLRGEARVEIKLPKEQEAEKAVRPARQPRRQEESSPARQVDPRLLARLMALRLELANKQSVPAYVVFSDSALTHMCILTPSTREEFLKVSGVGQVKLERYGDEFLRVINEFSRQFSSAAQTPDGSGEEPNPVRAEEIEVSDEAVTVSIIADRINCALMRRGIKRTTAAKINEWLLEEGYLQTETADSGQTFKIPTARGGEIGIISEERQIRGSLCKINIFSESAQRLAVEGFVDKLTQII